MTALLVLVGFLAGIVFTVVLAVLINDSEKRKHQQEKMDNRQFQYTNISGPVYSQDDDLR